MSRLRTETERVALAQEIAEELRSSTVEAQVSAQVQRLFLPEVGCGLLNVLVVIDGQAQRLGEVVRSSRLRVRGVPAAAAKALPARHQRPRRTLPGGL